MSHEFKVGDTFALAGPLEAEDAIGGQIDLTGAVAYSQLRTNTGGKIADLVVSIENGILSVRYPGDTQNWPIGLAQIDVQFILPTGDKVSSNTSLIKLVRDVTVVNV